MFESAEKDILQRHEMSYSSSYPSPTNQLHLNYSKLQDTLTE